LWLARLPAKFPPNLELHPNHPGCVKKLTRADIESLLVTADDKKAAKLEIELAIDLKKVARLAAAKKGPRKAAAKKSAKRGVRNPVATLTKTHAAATKKVATAQKALGGAIAAEQKAAAKLAAATAKAEAKAAKAEARLSR
jgi:hypothetical protein